MIFTYIDYCNAISRIEENAAIITEFENTIRSRFCIKYGLTNEEAVDWYNELSAEMAALRGETEAYEDSEDYRQIESENEACWMI